MAANSRYRFSSVWWWGSVPAYIVQLSWRQDSYGSASAFVVPVVKPNGRWHRVPLEQLSSLASDLSRKHAE